MGSGILDSKLHLIGMGLILVAWFLGVVVYGHYKHVNKKVLTE